MSVALTLRAIAMCSVFAGLAACSPPIRPGQVTEIFVSRPDCARGCVSMVAELRQNGTVTYGDWEPMKGFIGKSQYLQLVQMLLADPPVRRGANIEAANGAPSSTLLLRYGCCATRMIRFPTYPPLGAADVNDPARGLNLIASSIVAAAERAVHQPVLRRLERWKDLRAVSYSGGGGLCVRIPCGYSIAITEDGAAVLHRAGTFTGHIPFRTVLGLLQSGAPALDAYYPPVGEDFPSATLTLKYAGGWSYRVFAPDANTWPPQLREIDGAFAQLVRDTAWNPAR